MVVMARARTNTSVRNWRRARSRWVLMMQSLEDCFSNQIHGT